MNTGFNFSKITARDIENMLYLVAAYGGKVEGKRFDGLLFEQKQKVTLIFKERIQRVRGQHEPLDKFTIREVIDDAKKYKYLYKGILYD